MKERVFGQQSSSVEQRKKPSEVKSLFLTLKTAFDKNCIPTRSISSFSFDHIRWSSSADGDAQFHHWDCTYIQHHMSIVKTHKRYAKIALCLFKNRSNPKSVIDPHSEYKLWVTIVVGNNFTPGYCSVCSSNWETAVSFTSYWIERLWSDLHTEAFSPVVFYCLIKSVIRVKQTVLCVILRGGILSRRSLVMIEVAGWYYARQPWWIRFSKSSYFIRMHTDVTLSFMLQTAVMSAILITMYALPYYIEVWSEGLLSPSHSQLVMFRHILSHTEEVQSVHVVMFSFWCTLHTGKRNWSIWMNSENIFE